MTHLSVLGGTVAALTLAACGSVYKVEPASTTSQTDGLYYSLPRNDLVVTLPVQTAEQEPGPFSACPYPGNKITGPDSKTRPGTPTFTTSAEPDPAQRYKVVLESPGNPFADRSLSLGLGEGEIISSFTSSVTDRSADFAIDVVQTAAGLLVGAAPTAAAAPINCATSTDVANARARIRALKGSLDALNAGTAGPANMDKELYEKLVADLKSEIAKQEALFLGSKSSSTKTHTFVLEPELCVTTPCFAKLLNAAVAPDSSLDKIANNTYKVKTVAAAIGAGNLGTFLEINPVRPVGVKTSTSGGFVYRIPGRADMKIRHLSRPAPMAAATDEIISEETVPIAQFGRTAALPQRFGYLKSEIKELKLDPKLGSITSLSINSTGLSSDQITEINKTVTELTSDKTIARLEAEKTRLTLEKEVKALRDEAEAAAAQTP